MPNYCSNILSPVECSSPGAFQEALRPYLSECEGHQTLDFQKIIPMPADLNVTVGFPLTPEAEARRSSNLERYGFESWYDWRIQNWGTKWNSYSPRLEEDFIAFDTAWAPPIPVIARLSVLLGIPLTLDYCEEGVDFIGRYTAQPDGSNLDECFKCHEAPEWLRNIFFLEEAETEESK